METPKFNSVVSHNRQSHSSVLMVVLALILILTGCTLNLSRSRVSEIDILPQADVELLPFNSGGVACPGQLVNITWEGGSQLPRCEGREGDIVDVERCKTATLGTSPGVYSFSFSILPEHLNGETQIVMPDSYQLQATYRTVTDPYSRTGAASDTAIVYNADEIDLAYHIIYAMVCDPATRTWQWTRFSDSSDRLPPCAGISRVCNNDPVTVRAADGTVATMSEWRTCDDVTFRGQRPADLTLEPGDPLSNSYIGQSCVPGEPFPGPSGVDVSRVGYRVECMPPEGLTNPAASSVCMGLTAETVTEPVTYGEGAPDDMLYQFCDLEMTCGDGVCEPYCEIEDNCPQDCEGGQDDVTCDLETTCGDATCDENCENVENCAQDCESTSQAVSPVPAAFREEIFPVYFCKFIGGETFEWYEVKVGFDEAGNKISEQVLSGPIQGTWQGGCPGVGGDDGGDDGGGDGPQCGPNDPNCP